MSCSAGANRVRPDLDQLFGLPSVAITLQAAIGFTPTGAGWVYSAAIKGGTFAQVQHDVRALLDADSQRGGTPAEFSRDAYGYSWSFLLRPSERGTRRSGSPGWLRRA